MTPDDAKTHDEAIEALIAASLRAPDEESAITEQQISRYVDGQVTLSPEDEQALAKSKSAVSDAIKRILHGDKEQKSVCASETRTSDTTPRKRVGPTGEFIEAIVIAQLTRLLSSPEYPLGRFRYNKFAYFSHRRAEEEVNERFLKKAAGPYSPWARYKGPEGIALKNGYVQRAETRDALLPGDKVENIDPYLERYPVCRAIDWVVERFRYKKNEELELLATVDFAAVDLKKALASVSLDSVKQVIADNREWKPKLKRAVFSDENIESALNELRDLFPTTYAV